MRVSSITEFPCFAGELRNGRRTVSQNGGEVAISSPKKAIGLFRENKKGSFSSPANRDSGSKKKGKERFEIAVPKERKRIFAASIPVEKQERRLDVCSSCKKPVGCFLIIERTCEEDSCGHKKCPFTSGRMNVGDVSEKGICRQCEERRSMAAMSKGGAGK
jgi:hypothetical protein